ncbi:MAG TPA: type II secretion system protein [Verrucomicrobiae bacterium]|jgi:type II secretory pathway pseudopilin PulG|nr:type II secretion system protein [Verrucomicrobiae bacterium]
MASKKLETQQAKSKWQSPAIFGSRSSTHNRRITNAGFTIVETLFVLAIAGLILLIVFLALPALERSSRNNQRRQDVSTILEAVSHWELNNSGNIPTAADNFLQYYKLSYYDPTTGVTIHADASGSPTSVNPVSSVDTVDIYNYQRCSTTTAGGSTSTGAGYSDIVALYGLESGNSSASAQCQQL